MSVESGGRNARLKIRYKNKKPRNPEGNRGFLPIKMVGASRVELETFCTPSKRATRLRYAPKGSKIEGNFIRFPADSSNRNSRISKINVPHAERRDKKCRRFRQDTSAKRPRRDGDPDLRVFASRPHKIINRSGSSSRRTQSGAFRREPGRSTTKRGRANPPTRTASSRSS